MKSLRLLIVGCLLGSVSAGVAVAQGLSGSLFGSSTGDEFGNEKYSVNFQNADIRNVLQFVAEVADVNLIVPLSTTGTVSLQLNQVGLREIVDSLTSLHHLGYSIENGIMSVGPKSEFIEKNTKYVTEAFRLRYASASDLEENMGAFVSDNGAVMADARTNSLVVRDTVESVEQMRTVLARLDGSDTQILIEGRIAEVSRDWGRQLGIQWGGNVSSGGVRVAGLSAVGESGVTRAEGETPNNLFTTLPAGRPNSGIGVVVGLLGGRIDLDSALTAAETSGHVDVISEPSIVTSAGVAASISSGETFNIKTEGGQATGGTVKEIASGVELDVTPSIVGEGMIKLDIEASTSSPDFSRAVDGIPALLENKAQTIVVVNNGEATVIGGLARFTGRNQKAKVPGLGHLPLLGYLFRSKQRAKTNSELMVFIRPRILGDGVIAPMATRYHETEKLKYDATVRDERIHWKNLKKKYKEEKAALRKLRNKKAKESGETSPRSYKSRYSR